ncbi:MAG: hypothetical protein B7Z73_18125 [Planctomycetia bacterium 21-64-5]|nr:MAG: hypothetical protein B7Z73_18125 [Planctomycetia bacterium 21-64-5]
MLRRLVGTIVRGPVRVGKALGRRFERRLARRISERYADDITQFAALAHAMRELNENLTARLDKQEGFQWDHVALARRLAALEDHVSGLLDQTPLDEDDDGRSVVRLPVTETFAATTALEQLGQAG